MKNMMWTISKWIKKCIVFALKQVDQELYKERHKEIEFKFDKIDVKLDLLSKRIDTIYDTILSIDLKNHKEKSKK